MPHADRGRPYGRNHLVSRLVRAEERSLVERCRRNRIRSFHYGDQELRYQQNLTGRKMVLVVFSTNNWSVSVPKKLRGRG